MTDKKTKGLLGYIRASLNSPKKLMFFMPVCVSLLFTVMIYLPLDSYMSAYSDFDFTAGILLAALLPRFFYALCAAVLIVFLKNSLLKRVVVFLSAAELCVYIQYMLMNKNLGMLDGSKNDWSGNEIFGVVNIAVWAAVFVLFFVLYFKSGTAKNAIVFGIPGFLGAIQLVSAVIMLAGAPHDIWRLSGEHLSGSKQFCAAPGKNTIVFVWDTFDNDYLRDIEKNAPGLLQRFNDFTVYTNTCSVYDCTNASMTQMFTGIGFDNTLTADEFFDKAWNSPKADEFYARLHKAGYSVNYYNMPIYDFSQIRGKLDNVEKYDPEAMAAYGRAFSRKSIAKYFYMVAAYRALPYLSKRYIDINGFDMAGLRVNDTKINVISSNAAFENALTLGIEPTWENALIMQHLEGMHGEDTPEHCLEISLKYIDELKRLGLYENADIIFTADHGKHNYNDTRLCATPLFMIKRAGESHDSPVFNGAPIYHTDIQATILDCAGCYSAKTDAAEFGTDIYAWGEGDKRERTWYDRGKSGKCPAIKVNDTIMTGINAYFAYTYTGDTEDLRKTVETDNNAEILPMTEYIG